MLPVLANLFTGKEVKQAAMNGVAFLVVLEIKDGNFGTISKLLGMF